MKGRWIIAFFVAPLLPGLAMGLVFVMRGLYTTNLDLNADMHAIAGLLFGSGAIGYPVALLMTFPILRWLRGDRLGRLSVYLCFALVLGLVPYVEMWATAGRVLTVPFLIGWGGLVGLPIAWMILRSPATASLSLSWLPFGMVCTTGAMTFFWFVARPDRVFIDAGPAGSSIN